MNVAAGALLFNLVGLGTPAALFLWRAIPLRRKRPELLQNGLWFMLPFLLWVFTWLFSLIIAPIALVIVIVLLCLPKRKNKGALFYAALGYLTVSVLGFTDLYVLNTYFVAQR